VPCFHAYEVPTEADSPPGPKHAGGDVRRLVDGLPGGRPGTAPVTRAHGENWVGWEGTDAVITVHLPGDERGFARLSFHALQGARS
jgi:hypothetical protein